MTQDSSCVYKNIIGRLWGEHNGRKGLCCKQLRNAPDVILIPASIAGVRDVPSSQPDDPVMSMRRLTRLTNAFSKKVENHAAALALYFMYYNFGRKHQSLGMTPAMAAGIADHVWSVEEIVSLANSN
jgi:hypothetical protein